MRATLVAIAVVLAASGLAALALAHPSEEGEKYVSVAWDPDGTDGPPAGRKIVVLYRYTGGYSCQYRFHSATARETSDSVTIKVLAHRRELRQGEACTAELGGGRAVVKLRRELGNRELRHAPTTDPVPIDHFPRR
jgi:hypothetical protein